jgi:hypothetical protein
MSPRFLASEKRDPYSILNLYSCEEHAHLNAFVQHHDIVMAEGCLVRLGAPFRNACGLDDRIG